MLSITLVILGVIILFAGLVISVRFLNIVFKTPFRRRGIVLFGLILSFIFGYAAFLYILVSYENIERFFWTDKLVSLILFFGSIFVVIVSHLICFTYIKLKENEKELEKTIKELERAKTNIEKKIADRTAELEKTNKSLEKMNKVMVGRELKMLELKKEVKELKSKLKADH